MVEAKLYVKLYKAEPKTSKDGKKYAHLTLTDSIKNKETDEWVNNWYYVNIFKDNQYYDSFVEALQAGTIKTVEAAKKDATKLIFTCSVKAGANYKTQEPELQFSFKSWEIAVDASVKTSNVQPNYEAAKVQAVATSAESEEDYDTNPPW